jgi:hypothetical protein
MSQHRPYAPDWLDAESAAYMLSLPVSTFHQYVANGVLPKGVVIEKHTRWSREALNASLASKDTLRKPRGIREAMLEIAHGQESKGRDHAA